MWLAENLCICQSWIILFSRDSSSCCISFCTAYRREGKNYGPMENFYHMIWFKLIINIYDVGAVAGNYMCSLFSCALSNDHYNTHWLGERGEILQFLCDTFHPFVKYSCDALLVTNKSQFFSKSFCSGKEGNS